MILSFNNNVPALIIRFPGKVPKMSRDWESRVLLAVFGGGVMVLGKI
jgi:hypothetical protein